LSYTPSKAAGETAGTPTGLLSPRTDW